VSKIQRIQWSLLSEWWCAPVDADPVEIAQLIIKETQPPTLGLIDLVTDRLYGGFGCALSPNCRHIMFNTGAYTYLKPERNTALAPEERAETWRTIIEASKGKGRFIGGGPFCDDAPTQEEHPQDAA